MRNLILIIVVFFSLTNFSYSQTNTNKLKAILIVGTEEDDINESIQEMNSIATFFKKNKVEVHTFYGQKAKWEEIVKIAPDCSFLVYSRHGSKLGINGNAGGICINPTISTDELLKSLRLKENALVIFKSVCNGAGSSAGDMEDIGIDEAKNRVNHYAYPFFEVGANAYYANNFKDGTLSFLEDFFNGITLKDAFIHSTKTWTTIEMEETFFKDKNKKISIATKPGGGTATLTTYENGKKTIKKVKLPKTYDIAYVGNPSFSINELKK